jgi:hypothetical protein
MLLSLKRLSKGEQLVFEGNKELIIKDDVPEGHKITTVFVPKDEDV